MWCIPASMTSLLEHSEEKQSQLNVEFCSKIIPQNFLFVLIKNGQKSTDNIIFNVNLLCRKKYNHPQNDLKIILNLEKNLYWSCFC